MNKYVKGFLYTVSYLAIGFVVFCVLALTDAPAKLIPLIFVIPAIVLFICAKINNLTNRESINESASSSTTVAFQSFDTKGSVERLPSVRKCKMISDSLIAEAKRYIFFAHSASSIDQFFSWSNTAKTKLEQAVKYEEKVGYSYTTKPSYQLERFEDELQWKLRDAIEREEAELINEVLGPQRNNRRACCKGFIDEIEAHKNQLSEESFEFALNAYYHVCSAAGLTVQTSLENKIATPMEQIDLMGGQEFEYYCADLLSKNGFSNVEVTKGSGDQGIDILALKDDVKYAIQCKCYSSDLGNTPVQEAFAGKSFYNCQVAAVLTNRFFTQGGIDAAKATGVLLWDRNKLQFFIDNAH